MGRGIAGLNRAQLSRLVELVVGDKGIALAPRFLTFPDGRAGDFDVSAHQCLSGDDRRDHGGLPAHDLADDRGVGWVVFLGQGRFSSPCPRNTTHPTPTLPLPWDTPQRYGTGLHGDRTKRRGTTAGSGVFCGVTRIPPADMRPSGPAEYE
ncbi:hypothetical protein MANAM107_09630 [Actinomyces capricornis]|uniref:Uncharacterized protein n=1 Tax=Actinomyces capricornis TaxID=2755559 RepID=A0ABN6K3E9_9ACTO|nr:hypothetical protein MANAM107_09630 [Actinomyces capricornis]